MLIYIGLSSGLWVPKNYISLLYSFIEPPAIFKPLTTEGIPRTASACAVSALSTVHRGISNTRMTALSWEFWSFL